MIPHRARPNGMAYWQDREEKERARRRRPRSEIQGHGTKGGAEASRGGHGGAKAGGMVAGGGDGQWEDEKEEVRVVSNSRFPRCRPHFFLRVCFVVWATVNSCDNGCVLHAIHGRLRGEMGRESGTNGYITKEGTTALRHGVVPTTFR